MQQGVTVHTVSCTCCTTSGQGVNSNGKTASSVLQKYLKSYPGASYYGHDGMPLGIPLQDG